MTLGATCSRYGTFKTRNVRCPHSRLGVKGAGEAGAIGFRPAVMNAVLDAIWRALPTTHLDMPATPERVSDAEQGRPTADIGGNFDGRGDTLLPVLVLLD
jgi:hypothetical protein